ncbi:hypothetical protein Tco_1578282 [Tanacetum coccineum]
MKWELEAETRSLDDREVATWLEARRAWLEKDREQAKMLKQKARIRWVIKGDENTKFFHSVIKRRNKECVRPTFTSEMIAKISAEDAGALERQFEEKEIWDAIYGCGSEKASGPDEFQF